MNDMRRRNPREFWKTFKKKSPYRKGENMTVEEFVMILKVSFKYNSK
jgi:hypothetical protein